MARVVFFTSPEPSHVNATFGLAKTLQGRGHDVVYLTTADLEGHVAKQGLAARVVLDDVMPRGTHARFAKLADLERQLTAQMHERINAGALDDALAELRPHVFLVDPWVPTAAFVGYRRGLDVVMISPTLPRVRDPLVPSANDLLVPNTSTRRAIARLKFGAHQYSARARHALGLEGYFAYERFALASGYPMELFDRAGGFPRLLAFPQLVLCPKAFDLPRERPLPNVEYSESFVDTARIDEVPFDDGWLEPARRLVYFSFGTLTHRSGNAPRLVAAVVEALGRQHERLQGIISVSPHLRAEIATVPPNVRLEVRVPQLEVLRRSALMINHGGLNSIKECIELGVPMLVIPWAQPINAVRVAYHGLGEVLAPSRVRAATVEAAMLRVLDSQATRDRVDAMRAAFRRAAQSELGASMIEGRLARQDNQS